MTAYSNKLSLNHELKGISYGGIGEVRVDGGANYGFKNLKGNPGLIDSVPELQRDPSLRRVIERVNEAGTDLFSIGCVSSDVHDDHGYRLSGYVEFSLNSISGIQDASNYFRLFFHFDRLLYENHFPESACFDWELQPAQFHEANSGGFTCTIFINTSYFDTREKTENCWANSLNTVGQFLGSVPKQSHDPIYR